MEAYANGQILGGERIEHDGGSARRKMPEIFAVIFMSQPVDCYEWNDRRKMMA